MYYDVINNQINEGNPLPSEEEFYIKGQLPKDIEVVVGKIYNSSKNSKNAKTYTWKKPFDFNVNQFEIFIADPLRSNDKYTVELHYYQRADQEQMEELRTSINNNLSAYIHANFEISRSKIISYNNDKVILAQLNQIVEDGTKNYRHFIHQEFEGFSDIVKQKLEQKDQLKLKRSKFNIIGKSKDSGDNDRALYASKYLTELTSLVENEANQFLASSMFALADIRAVEAYPTIKKPSSIPLNIGYGAVAMKRSFAETEYLNGIYAGFSAPLGNKAFTKFLGNASFSAGFFLKNFESDNGTKVSGPFVDLPIYAGLGYKLLRVIRFNAGLVAVNTESQSENNEFHLQPFAGFSLELDLWLGLNQKR
ncbi:hypothetical protein GCM10028791_31250 [Echinicola sediminis]